MSIKSRALQWSLIAICTGAIVVGPATAAPILQLYIEGATYDQQEQGWYIPTNTNFRLWAIGNLTGPGGSGGLPITNVRLAAVYDDPGQDVTITIAPTRIGGVGTFNGFDDPSTPNLPTWLRTVADGSTPDMGDHRHLPNHGEYGAGRTWQEFRLSDFSSPDSQLGSFINDFPVPSLGDLGQIHAYDITVAGAFAHFDLYGEITDARGRTSYVFAPPSYDATDGPNGVPLPATLALLGIGGLGLAACRGRSVRACKSTLPERA